jgi:hypothetical protein
MVDEMFNILYFLYISALLPIQLLSQSNPSDSHALLHKVYQKAKSFI